MRIEYWCQEGRHWVAEVRIRRIEEVGDPRCKECADKTGYLWLGLQPIVREVPDRCEFFCTITVAIRGKDLGGAMSTGAVCVLDEGHEGKHRLEVER